MFTAPSVKRAVLDLRPTDFSPVLNASRVLAFVKSPCIIKLSLNNSIESDRFKVSIGWIFRKIVSTVVKVIGTRMQIKKSIYIFVKSKTNIRGCKKGAIFSLFKRRNLIIPYHRLCLG